MKEYKPYQFWTREKLYDHCVAICGDYNADDMLIELRKIIFDNRWNPMEHYNGCNMIQDRLHPYPPCLIHDFRWMVEGGGIKTDREFRSNLMKLGETFWQAEKKFIGVRLGWLFYYKWKKISERRKSKK